MATLEMPSLLADLRSQQWSRRFSEIFDDICIVFAQMNMMVHPKISILIGFCLLFKWKTFPEQCLFIICDPSASSHYQQHEALVHGPFGPEKVPVTSIIRSFSTRSLNSKDFGVSPRVQSVPWLQPRDFQIPFNPFGPGTIMEPAGPPVTGDGCAMILSCYQLLSYSWLDIFVL